MPTMGNASKPVKTQDHAFQQVSVLRLARCDHCGDKLWGSQLRCSGMQYFISLIQLLSTPSSM
jgi:hypothetical protein